MTSTFYLDDIQFDDTKVSPSSSSSSAPTRKPCYRDPAGTLTILDGTFLCSHRRPVGSYDFGVDSSGGRRDWLKTEGDALRMDYPPNQQWGAVFLTVGKPVPPGDRPGQDFSKNNSMPDGGSETKIRVPLKNTWETKSFPLSSFAGVDLTKVYVVIEFVFETSDPPQTVYFRNVRFLCSGM
jgi:hypothetical protein